MIRDIELAGLCQTIARDTGLEVTVGGENSCISPDGMRLNIAAMPMTPEGRLVAVGLAWHEVGHKLYTDMEGGPGDGLLGNLVNVIEDVREERDFILDRPGTAYDLDAVTTYYVSKGHMIPNDIPSALISLTMGYGRTELLGQKAMQKPMEMAREIIEKNFGGAYLALVEGILKTFHSMPTGKDGTEISKDMARQLVQLLEQQAQEQKADPDLTSPQPDSESDPDTDEDGNGGGKENDDGPEIQENVNGNNMDTPLTGSEKDKEQAGGNSKDQGKLQDAEYDSNQSHDKNRGENSRDGRSTGSNADTVAQPEKGNSPSDTSGSPAPSSEGIEGQEQASTDQAQSGTSCKPRITPVNPETASAPKKPDPAMIMEMIEEGGGEFGNLRQMGINELNNLSSRVTPEERSLIPQFPRVDRVKPFNPVLVNESRCITTTSRMRAKLMGLLQAAKSLPERFGVSGRKLAVKRLVRLVTGDPRMFRKRVESIAINTAVVVLLDRSGSMDHKKGMQSRITVARNAAFSLHHALSGISGVAVHSVAFEMDDVEQCTPPIKVLCNWSEKPHSEYFGVETGFYTPTPWALWYARAVLLARPEPRKIVLLVTDGKPEGWERIEADTRAATRRLYRDGIEIAAIGIVTDMVQQYWKNNRVIDDIDELPQAMFGVMTELLTRKVA